MRRLLVVACLATATAHADPTPGPDILKLTDDPVLSKADRVVGEDVKGMVAFTFDDGPNPDTTPAVIDALEKYDIPATFFVVMKRITTAHNADQARDLLKRELDSGFLVGSHTVTHTKLRRAGPLKLAAEIDESIRILSKATNRTIGLFRAPFGHLEKLGHEWVKRRGLTEVFWSIDPRDWESHDDQKLRKKVVQEILDQNGGVVLMHDAKSLTAGVVAEILDDLEAENCRRLSVQTDPILPVSLHYFLRDNKLPRAIPEDVQKRTDAYKLALPLRCAKRAATTIPPNPDTRATQ